MLLVFFTITVFMLMLIIAVQKGCNGVVDVYRIIQTILLSPDQMDSIREDEL